MCNKIFALRASTSIPRNIRSISPTTTPKEIEDNEGLDLISLSTYEKGRRVIHHCCRWEWLSSFADLLRGWWLQKNGTKGLIREDLDFNILVVGYVTYSKDYRFYMKTEKRRRKRYHSYFNVYFVLPSSKSIFFIIRIRYSQIDAYF